MSEHRVKIENGKYTMVSKDGWRLDILRHDELWIENITAAKCLHGAMCELDAARVVVKAAREFLAAHDAVRSIVGGPDSIGAIRDALEKHSALVDDREPPSEWASIRLPYRTDPA